MYLARHIILKQPVKKMGCQRTLFFLLTVALVQICYGSNENRRSIGTNCIPLSNCAPILNLLLAKHSELMVFSAVPLNNNPLPNHYNLSRAELFNYLRKITCGYRGSEAFVRCPKK